MSLKLHTAQREKENMVASLTLEKNQLMGSLTRTAEKQGILESELSSLQTELSTALSQAEANKKATDTVHNDLSRWVYWFISPSHFCHPRVWRRLQLCVRRWPRRSNCTRTHSRGSLLQRRSVINSDHQSIWSFSFSLLGCEGSQCH